MKPNYFLSTILILFLTSTTLQAQSFEVPNNYSLKVAEDYKKHEQDVINGINWIESTPLNEQHAKRKDVNAFLMKWMTGSPTVSIGVNAYLVEVTSKNPELLIIFLGGWTKHAIENPNDSSDLNGNVAGMKSVINVYKMNKDSGSNKDRALEKLVKLKSDNDLEKWVKKQLKN